MNISLKVDILNLQKALVDWFWFEQNQLKEFNIIENICIKIYEQYFPKCQAKDAKYRIFYPLIRRGIIEFYGNNKFGLSPTSVLYKENRILLSNFPRGLIDYSNVSPHYNDSLGIQIFENHPYITSVLKECNIPYSQFSLFESLNKISEFGMIINNWDEEKVIDARNYLFFNSNNSWSIRDNNYLIGVFKKNEKSYAERILRVSKGHWKSVPLRKNNIEAYNIAIIWSQLQNNWNLGIEYFPKIKKLTINNSFFPFIIERLLFINSSFQQSQVYNSLPNTYYIKEKEFNVLNKLFNYKIKINE